MHKRLMALAALVLATASGGGYVLTTQAGAASIVGNTFSVQEHFVASANEPGKASLAPGQTSVEKATLTQGSTVVGESRFACTDVFDTTILCTGAFTITGQGILMVQGITDPNHNLPGFDAVVTGGTGAFAAKDGWVHFDERPSNGSIETFYLSA
jgi:hypothetical protein